MIFSFRYILIEFPFRLSFTEMEIKCANRNKTELLLGQNNQSTEELTLVDFVDAYLF